MAPFEVLYDRKCHTRVTQDILVDQLMLGTELLKELEQIVKKVQPHLKYEQNRLKSYTNRNRPNKEYQVGEHVYLKMKAKKSSLNLGTWKKLPPKYCGPFEILATKGHVA